MPSADLSGRAILGIPQSQRSDGVAALADESKTVCAAAAERLFLLFIGKERTNMAAPLSPFLIGRTVSLPNILRTVRRTIIRFLKIIELRRTFSSPNMIRTVRRTILRFLTGL